MDRTDIERTKRIMEDLAFGKNPITGGKLPNDTILNDVNLARSFFFVSKILDDLLKNEKKVAKSNVPQVPFHITEEQRNMALSDEHIGIARFVSNIRNAINDKSMQIPSANQILNWLTDKGLMYKKTNADTGRYQRLPTNEGQFIGIGTEEREYNGRKYMGCFYSRNAQIFILDNMDSILGNNTDA